MLSCRTRTAQGMTPVALLWLAMKRTGNLFAACAFPVEGLPVAGPVGFDFAFDGVAGDFARVFGGDFSAVAVADDFEADLVAVNFAVLDLGFIFVANGGAGQFVAILF